MATIEAFLQCFCVPSEADQLDNFEIYIGENQKYGIPEMLLPVVTRREALLIGISNPQYGFAFYFSGGVPAIKSGIVQFTYDGKMVFGLSIEDRLENGDDNVAQARNLAKALTLVTRADKSFVASEYPPPLDEDEFNADTLVWQELNKS